MMGKKRISRREFLRLSAVAAAGLAVTACQTPAENLADPVVVDPPADDTDVVEPAPVDEDVEDVGEVELPSRYNQSPMLAALVDAGQLPPVDERLPQTPQIVQPWHEIGEYGGEYTVISPAANAWHSARTGVGIEGVLRIGTDLVSAEPNIIESYAMPEDGLTLTMFLRQGMRWSDGEPVVADDFLFWYDDVILNDELTPSKPTWFRPGGNLARVEKIDDYTIRIVFDQPYPFIFRYLAHNNGTGIWAPSHYLKQFHPHHVPLEEVEAMAAAEGYDDWMSYFNYIRANPNGAPLNNPDLPCLTPYMLVERTQTYWLLERNPYYWKVDPEGNQLPYIDACMVRLIQDSEAQDAAYISGDADIEFGWNVSAAKWPLYSTNQDAGNYRAFTVPNLTGAVTLFQPNMTYEEDTVIRDIFRDRRFRIALSLGIDREEISEMVFFGRATPQQATVIPASSFYVEEYAKLNTEYDPDRANELLDEMGLEWNANREYRLRPDGQPVAWTIESGIDPQTSDLWQLVRGYREALGLDVSVRTITGELTAERYPGNQVAMGTWGGDKCTDWLFTITPQFWVPYNLGWESTMYPLWTRYMVSDGETGEEPPDTIKRLWDLWQEMGVTVDQDRVTELGKEIVRINAEEMYVIGTVAMPPHPVIVKDNLENVPTPEQGLQFGWDLFQFYPWHNEQLFLKQPYYGRQEYDG